MSVLLDIEVYIYLNLLFQNGQELYMEDQQTPRHLIEHGVNEILFFGRSIRSVAAEIGICHMTLSRYVKQAEVNGSREMQIGYRSPQRIFTMDQENILKEYIIKAANIYFGLPPKDVNILAYECAL